MQRNLQKMTATAVNPAVVAADFLFILNSKAMKTNNPLQKDPGCCEAGSFCCISDPGCC
jgi:hypothetical protein